MLSLETSAARAIASLDEEIRQAFRRQESPASLSRIKRTLPCTPDQRVCKRCGKETVVIGYEESSKMGCGAGIRGLKRPGVLA